MISKWYKKTQSSDPIQSGPIQSVNGSRPCPSLIIARYTIQDQHTTCRDHIDVIAESNIVSAVFGRIVFERRSTHLWLAPHYGAIYIVAMLSPNSTWLATSRHDSTRLSCQAHAFWLCRACLTARLDTTSATGVTRRSQWSSGNTLACCSRRPRFESRCGQRFVFSRKSLRLVRYAALGTGCTLTAVPRSTQAATLRGWVIKPGDVRMFGL